MFIDIYQNRDSIENRIEMIDRNMNMIFDKDILKKLEKEKIWLLKVLKDKYNSEV